MKKRTAIKVTALILTAAILSGCLKEDSIIRTQNALPGVNDVIASGIAEADRSSENASPSDPLSESTAADERNSGLNGQASEPESIRENVPLSNTEGIDIDLTILSSTLIYSEVYLMMMDPQDYVGKTIRMRGAYTYYHDIPNDFYYHSCIIADATACCSQGLEFVPADAADRVFPEDYPEPGSEITVTGVFDTYLEDGRLYCTLRNAVLE